MKRTTLIVIEGTWGGRWARSDSAFRAFLDKQGFDVFRFRGWSGNIDGVWTPLSADGDADWSSGGYALAYFLKKFPYEDRNLLCHSHGINVALYQANCENDDCGNRVALPVRRLLSVCSPVRKTMQPLARTAIRSTACDGSVERPMIGRWRHIYASDWDLMQRMGEMFDGKVGWTRKWKDAHENVGVKGVGHSGLLMNPDYFLNWIDDGHIDFLHAR